MRVRLKKDYDFRPQGLGYRAVVAYKDGREYIVKREWGDAMVAAGAAEDTTPAAPATTEPAPDAN